MSPRIYARTHKWTNAHETFCFWRLSPGLALVPQIPSEHAVLLNWCWSLKFILLPWTDYDLAAALLNCSVAPKLTLNAVQHLFVPSCFKSYSVVPVCFNSSRCWHLFFHFHMHAAVLWLPSSPLSCHSGFNLESLLALSGPSVPLPIPFLRQRLFFLPCSISL